MASSFAFREIAAHSDSVADLSVFLAAHLVPLFPGDERESLKIGMRRALFHLFKNGVRTQAELFSYIDCLSRHAEVTLRELGLYLRHENERRPLVFLSAEAEPFSKSGGLATVVYELPREMVDLGQEVYVITPRYRSGDGKSMEKMRRATDRYAATYTGVNVRIKMMESIYEVGIHYCQVDGIHYFLLDHPDFFDGLYWGYTGYDKLRRRVAFARASAELITAFDISPGFVFTNDAFAGVFNGLIKKDTRYSSHPGLCNITLVHIIHNGGWRYFDSYDRYEHGLDHIAAFQPFVGTGEDFCDAAFPDRINCMSIGIRFADRVITVSPTYARQIEIASDGLERLLADVVGINNALGREFAGRIQEHFDDSGFVESTYPAFLSHVSGNPDLRGKIETRYPELLENQDLENVKDETRRKILIRARNKLLLQVQRGFTVDPDKVVFAMIHRVVEQKGFQLLLEASGGIIRDLGFQGIVGGPQAANDLRGQEIAQGLNALASHCPESMSVHIGFQDVSIPLLCCDVFLMPSMHEPGGISQLEAFSCGCLVVARATGGLRDTVFPIREFNGTLEGNGFLFTDFTASSFYDAMSRCAAFFYKTDAILVHEARTRAAQSVYYWDSSAKRYLDELYTLKEMIPAPREEITGAGTVNLCTERITEA